ESTARLVLHVQYTQRQLFQQGEVPVVASKLGEFTQGQQAHPTSPQLHLLAGVNQESSAGSIRQRLFTDQLPAKVSQRPAGGGFVARISGQFPTFKQRVGRACVAKGVVGGDGPVEAGEEPIFVTAI